MSEKNIILNDKKIGKSNFYKNKKLSKIDETDVDKTLVFLKKKNHMVQKIHLNTSLDIVMMVLFDHYV